MDETEAPCCKEFVKVYQTSAKIPVEFNLRRQRNPHRKDSDPRDPMREVIETQWRKAGWCHMQRK